MTGCCWGDGRSVIFSQFRPKGEITIMLKTIKSLYHITSVDNLPGILSQGVLSHEQITKKSIDPMLVYNSEIVNLRKDICTPSGKSLWHYANFYINVRNAMMYTVHRNKGNVVVLEVSPEILKMPGVYISVGNAASPLSEILPVEDGIKKICEPKMWEKIHKVYWTDATEVKRLGMSEVLVPNKVAPQYIKSIYAPDDKTQKAAQKHAGDKDVLHAPDKFFLPTERWQLSNTKISLVRGDMFLSAHQTLTISVNVVGVMGKGLASRAKYQFPDAYVEYENACKKGKIRVGKPFIYERTSKDIAWADRDYGLQTDQENTKFLFFPTKKDWRQNSKIEYVTEGLKWLVANYSRQNINSIALPALGCGLGRLKWRDVGPLMCAALHKMDIPAAIYLPNESTVPGNEKTVKFLLADAR